MDDNRLFYIKPFFKRYDFWVGVYYDKALHILYFCPIPMFGLKIVLPYKSKKKKHGMTEKQIDVLRSACGCINEPNIDLNKIKDFYKYGEDDSTK